jgi:Flp pilus assembly protein CpaB
MSRRARALAFLALALAAAAVGATIVAGYGSSVARGYGPLRRVVVAAGELPRGRPIGPEEIAALTVRRVPGRFVPPGALAAPDEALGLVPQARLPVGAYVLAAQLRPPGSRAAHGPLALAAGRRPVEISVSGAGALLEAGPAPGGGRVDVVVTSEPAGAGPGRTYVAVAGAPLLALGPGADGAGPGGLSDATLGLTRRQALRLIAAESFARKLTLLPRG